MHRLITFTAAVLVVGSYALADDDPDPPQTVKVYRVGDLVSADAMNADTVAGRTTKEEWGAEYRETIEALQELQTLISSVCESKPAGIGIYRPSLSLVVRHTGEGHREIEELLSSLRAQEAPCIKLECRALFSPDQLSADNLPKEHKIDEERVVQLVYSQSTVTPQEARELADMGFGRPTVQTVYLKSGHRTSWGDYGRPCTAVGRVLPEQGVAQIRIDNITDDVTDYVPFASQLYEIKSGESAVFHHHCDGGTMIWLITATVLSP